MAQSDRCPQEALGRRGDTAADSRLFLTQQTENLAQPGMQKKKFKGAGAWEAQERPQAAKRQIDGWQ